MNYIITPQTVSFFAHGRPYTAPRADLSERDFNQLVAALKEGDTDTAIRLVDAATAVTEYLSGSGDAVEIIGGQVVVNGKPIDTYPARRALEFMREGLPHEPILAFIERLQQNPSYRATQELYQFLEAGNMPLTDDGCFLAYKKVLRCGDDGKLRDIYSGTIDNSVGCIVEVPRNQVDEDPERTCSHGLHVCSYNYLPYYRSGSDDVVVVVKIDPKDVVAVPRDYNNAKMRVCRYEVLEIIEGWERGHDEHLGASRLRSTGEGWKSNAVNKDGECPVLDSSFVEVQLRDGTTFKDFAEGFEWHVDPSYPCDEDILAYRVLD